MKKITKNLMFMIVMAALCFAVAVTASALESTGQCGDNAFWNYDSVTGELVISGEGDMWDYVSDLESPFSDSGVKKLTVEKGITSIGECAFAYAGQLEEVIFDDCSLNIKISAFYECVSLDTIDYGEGDIYIEAQAFMSIFARELYFPQNVKSVGPAAFVMFPVMDKVYVEGMDTLFEDYSICITEAQLNLKDITVDEYIEKMRLWYNATDGEDVSELEKELDSYVEYGDIVSYGTIYCHSGSTAEAYAIENGVDYVLTHFFEGEWNYDYENMIRTRKCIHCDELETEPLEREEIGDVEIVGPTDPDTDFDVDGIEGTSEEFILVEEDIKNALGESWKVLKAFDITLKNKDGVHVQPNGTVKVKLPLDWEKDGNYKVYRVNDDGTLTDMNAYRQGSHMVFDTDHFSVYVIVEENADTDAPSDTPTEEPEEEMDFIQKLFAFVTKILNFFRKLFSK